MLETDIGKNKIILRELPLDRSA